MVKSSYTNYDAKISKDFITSNKLYENGPTFFRCQIEMKEYVFNDLNYIEIVPVTKTKFKNNFSNSYFDSQEFTTGDLLSFNSPKLKDMPTLFEYNARKFGENYNTDYVVNNENSDLFSGSIFIDKNKIKRVSKNQYDFFISSIDALRLVEVESSETSSDINAKIYFRIYFKDINSNIIWDSKIINLSSSLNEIYNNASLEYKHEYVTFFLEEFLRTASLQHYDNDINQISLEFINNYASYYTVSTPFNSFETFTQEDLDFFESLNTNIDVKYKDETFVTSNLQQLSISIDKKALVLDISNLNNRNIIINIVKEYYENLEKSTFEFKINLDFEHDESRRSIPEFVLSYDRNSNFISTLIEKFSIMLETKVRHQLENINIDFYNLDTYSIKHVIDTNSVLFNDQNLSNVRLKNIQSQTNADRDDYIIYFENNKLSRPYNFSDFLNLQEIKNIDPLVSNNITFYTYNSSSTISSGNMIKYKFERFVGDYVVEKDAWGARRREEDLENENFYVNLLVDLNNDIKNNMQLNKTSIDNVSLNLNNSTNENLINIESANFSNTSILSKYIQDLGYESFNDFVENIMLSIKVKSGFNSEEVPKRYLEKNYFFNFSQIFRSSQQTFNLEVKNSLNEGRDFYLASDMNLDFLNDAVVNKQQSFENSYFNNENSLYEHSVSIQAFPIHKLILKYRNVGLDESDSINNAYNNLEEVEEVELLFYTLFYSLLPNNNYSSFVSAKRSFFNQNETNDNFNVIVKRVFDEHVNLTDNYFRDNTRITHSQFREIIEDRYSSSFNNNINSDATFAENFSDNMFLNRNIENKNFVSEDLRLSYTLNNRELDIYYPNNLLINSNFIKYLDFNGGEYNDLNLGQIFEISNTFKYHVRMALTPYFVKIEDGVAVNTDFNNNLLRNTYHKDQPCLTLKEFSYSIMSSKNAVFEGSSNNNLIFSTGTEDFLLSVDTSKKFINNLLFKDNPYFRELIDLGIVNNLTNEGAINLYDLCLKVCILVEAPTEILRNFMNIQDDNQPYLFFSNYQQLSLFNPTKVIDSIPITEIDKFNFKLV